MEKLEKLRGLGATHVVSAINYGARAFLKFESKLTDFVDDQTIKGDLKVKFD